MRAALETKDIFLPPIRVEYKILKKIDELVEKIRYRSRSELIREAIEDKIAQLEGSEIIQLRNVSKYKAKKEILEYIKGKDRIYPSQIAEDLRLDLSMTFEIINELFTEGKLEDVK